MFESLEVSRMARALAAHSGERLGVIAENIANADTPGFKAKGVPDFETVWRESNGAGMKATRPGHLYGSADGPEPTALRQDGAASPNGNTVSLQKELARAAATRQDHEMALAVIRNAGDILRAALGRR